MTRIRNQFDILGVRRDATSEQIRDAFEQCTVRATIGRGPVSVDVHRAFAILSEPSNRQAYRELLEAAEQPVSLIRIPPERFEVVNRLCSETGLVLYGHPSDPVAYAVRFIDELPPPWAQPAHPPPPTWSDQVRALAADILLFRIFRNKSLGERTLLLGFYCAGIVGLYLAVIGVSGALEARRVARANEARAAFQASVRQAVDRAGMAVGQLQRADQNLAAEFAAAAGVPAANRGEFPARRPREVDLILLQQESFREAWADLLRAQITASELNSRQHALQTIRQRIDRGDYSGADRQTADEIAGWAARLEANIARQNRNLEHIRVMLAAERFANAPVSTERKTP